MVDTFSPGFGLIFGSMFLILGILTLKWPKFGWVINRRLWAYTNPSEMAKKEKTDRSLRRQRIATGTFYIVASFVIYYLSLCWKATCNNIRHYIYNHWFCGDFRLLQLAFP